MTAAERRNERARALGFTSYSQQYRASKRGYTGQGAEYNAALSADRTRRVTKVKGPRGKVVFSGPPTRALFAAARREAQRRR